ncbi:transcriptional regulator [Aureimonas sp. SA4125]|uniref:HVO_A0114 family putative DNA-binding protein n=1 Tax=Aureimonas sp. SA4125 TaxID=2826993 RepID=UPI001CC35E92|nr:transcriptional regulator [Aureimonas sp. SA4125]BDA86954.1 transcriptional regulator [Aureimonas sp. SA4125]
MTMVRLSVASRDDVSRRFAGAMKGEKQGHHISFASPDLIWQVLTDKRWALLKAMRGAGPMSIRGLARGVGRDVKAVHADVTALLSQGILERGQDGRIVFPYDGIHVDFHLNAA